MKEPELRSAFLGVRLRPSLKAKLEALAEKDKRTFSMYVEIVLEEHVEQKECEAPYGRKSGGKAKRK